MKKEERKGSNKILCVIVVLLLAAIVILLWLLFKPQPEPAKIPTGNVDVFDIRIGCLCGRKDNDDNKGGDGDDDAGCDGDADGFYPNVSPGKNG